MVANKASKKEMAAGISQSSFMELKAMVSERKEVASKDKAAGKSTSIKGLKRMDKKLSTWAKQNKDVQKRAARDMEYEQLDKKSVEDFTLNLKRKAELYDKLHQGDFDHLTDKQFDNLLVDFASKPSAGYDSDSDDDDDDDDVDESATVPHPPAQDDPVIEYTDEFGRVRSARRSDIPPHLLPAPVRIEGPNDGDDGVVIQNPVGFFPVYEPSADRVAAIQEAAAEENNPLNVHYDADKEVRAKGAGFYQFSGDEETRRKQMEELRAAREETEKKRSATGALDLKPGETEGMQEGDSKSSRSMNERKRKLEERRKLIEAKRRKMAGTDDAPSKPTSPQPTASTAPEVPASADPFAQLEAQVSRPTQVSEQINQPQDAAAAWLDNLQRELGSSGGK